MNGHCPNCAHLNPADAAFCARCGQRLATASLIGQTLNERYLIEKQIGEGGMGTVYQAADVRLNRKVAVKLLASELVSHPTARKRMTREATALARIKHPNVVQVFDVFDHGPQLALVLELVTAGDLSQFVRPGGIGEKQAVALMTGVLLGLQAIHESDLVHRDIKPENVLVSPQGTVKLADLGVAQDRTAKERTQLGARLGTPAYMSPEQAQGFPVDARSDLYSAALLLFELLTGERPFAGTGEFDILAARVNGEPNWALLAGKCSSHVREALGHALRRDPQQRPASAKGLLGALADPPAPRASVVIRPPTPTSSASPPPSSPKAVPPPPAGTQDAAPRDLRLILVAAIVLVAIMAMFAFAMSASGGRSVEPAKSPEAAAETPRPKKTAEPPPAVPEPSSPEADAAAAAGELCHWSVSDKSAWYATGTVISRALAGCHGYATFTATNGGTAGSQIVLDGTGKVIIAVAGKELLTTKTWSPRPEVEWIVGFWYDGSEVTGTFTRVSATAVTTKRFSLQRDTASDPRDGHFLLMKGDANLAPFGCIVQFGSDLGWVDKHGKSKSEQWVKFAFPIASDGGWPTKVDGNWPLTEALH